MALTIPGAVHGEHDAGSARLHYVAAGEGPLVILHHGFPSCWLSFHHQLRSLQDRFRVVAVDGLGANRSSRPAEVEAYRLAHLVELVDSLARHLGGDEPFALVGHDWGAALAWSFAQARPDRLRRVVAINAPPTNQLLDLLRTDPDQQARSTYMYEMREPATFAKLTEPGRDRLWRMAYPPLVERIADFDADLAEAFRQALAVPGAAAGGINWYRANIPPIDAITDADLWPAPDAAADVPAMLIWGEDDRTFVPGFIDQLPRYATDLRVERLTNTGHWPMLERPDTVNELLGGFLAPAEPA